MTILYYYYYYYYYNHHHRHISSSSSSSMLFYNSCRRLRETKHHSSLFLHWSGAKFLVVMAACPPSIHVFLGRPLFLLSSGIHSIINFGILSSGILLTWPFSIYINDIVNDLPVHNLIFQHSCRHCPNIKSWKQLLYPRVIEVCRLSFERRHDFLHLIIVELFLGFRSVVINPCFASSHNGVQKLVSFLWVAREKLLRGTHSHYVTVYPRRTASPETTFLFPCHF